MGVQVRREVEPMKQRDVLWIVIGILLELICIFFDGSTVMAQTSTTNATMAARAAGRQAAALRANQHDGLILPLLRAPLPRGLACVAMYAGPHRCSFAFFLDIVAAISDEGPGMAIGHDVGS